MSAHAWNQPQRITLGVKPDICRAIMDEWIYRQAATAVTVRRAKTAGLMLVIMDVDPPGKTQVPFTLPAGAYF